MRSIETVLPDTALAALLAAVTPEAPDDAVAARMLRRIRTRFDEPLTIRLRRNDGWTPLSPGIEQKVLFDDGVTVSWLLRLGPGADLPQHIHEDGPEECLVLEGEVWLGGERFGPGDYMHAPKGSRHATTRTETGAVMFLRTPSS